MKRDERYVSFPSPTTQKKSISRFRKRLLYGLLLCGGSMCYVNYFRTDIKYYYQKTHINDYIFNNSPELNKRKFKATWYLPTAFMQIIYGAVGDENPYIPYDRELVDLKDQGKIALDWLVPLPSVDKEETRILLILHGLSGGSEANYVRHAVQNSQRNGFRTAVMNNRGINSQLYTPKYYNFASTEDLAEIVQHIKQKYPKADLYCMGLSMGGNIAMNYAGEKGEKCEFKALTCLANPFDLEKCAHLIATVPNWIYHWSILNNFKKNYFKTKDMLLLGRNFDPEVVEKSRTIEEYDRNFTAKIHGYNNVHEYYRQVGCKKCIQHVKIPVLCMHSWDDPIVDNSVIPMKELQENPNIIFVQTPRGGHIDWFTTRFAKRWAYLPAIEFLLNIEQYNKTYPSGTLIPTPTITPIAPKPKAQIA
jgi:predicted alpha/beta-fold hydrolase